MRTRTKDVHLKQGWVILTFVADSERNPSEFALDDEQRSNVWWVAGDL